jgi:hypothetical protein
MLEVEGEAALAAVDGKEVRALAVNKRGAPSAGVVTLARLLDLDDVGPRIRERLRAIRTGEDPRQVDDVDAGERLRQW